MPDRLIHLAFFIIGCAILFRHEPIWVPWVGGAFFWLGIQGRY